MSNSKPDTKELFENIKKFVDDSRNLLKQGANAEMAGMDKQVQELCAGVLQVSDDEREKYADLLQSLMDDLTALESDLVTKREALAHEIRYLSSHKKANVAYKTSDAVDGKNKNDGDE